MKRTAENQVNAGARGGIEAVVKAINTHINNAGVCENGCGTLWNITRDSRKSMLRHNKQHNTKMNS